MKYIPEPKTMVAIKDLSLAAKMTLDSFMAGLHRSRVKGEGTEFSQYRQYMPGDDLRNLDWKVLARTGRHYIKQSEPEQNIAVHLMLDASASMKHDCGGYQKIDYARYLAACLALLAYRQGDKIGLSFFNETDLKRIMPQQHGQQLQIIYQSLSALQANGRLENREGFKWLVSTKQKELMVFITDFYEHDDEIMRLIKLFVAVGHEVVVLHLMAANELDGSFKSYDALQDAETGEIVVLGSISMEKHKQLVESYLSRSRHMLLENKVHYCLVNANDPPEKTLREFLVYRNSLTRR